MKRKDEKFLTIVIDGELYFLTRSPLGTYRWQKNKSLAFNLFDCREAVNLINALSIQMGKKCPWGVYSEVEK